MLVISASPHLGILHSRAKTETYKPKGSPCAHTGVLISSPSHSLGSSGVLTCTHTLTCSHTVTLLGRFTLTWPSQTPALTQAPICLHTLLKCILHNKVTLKAHNHTLAHKHSYTLTMTAPPHTHRFRHLWKHIRSLSHLTHLPLQPQAHPLARLHLLAHSPHIHSYTPAAAESSTTGRPAPPTCAHLREVA